jgi:hypothetical protein
MTAAIHPMRLTAHAKRVLFAGLLRTRETSPPVTLTNLLPLDYRTENWVFLDGH